MKDFFKELNAHEQTMLGIWYEYDLDGYDYDYDDEEPEELSFPEWLEKQIAYFSSQEEEEYDPEFTNRYRQALAEWTAEC